MCRNLEGSVMGAQGKARVADTGPRLATYDRSQKHYRSLATRQSDWWGIQSCTCRGDGTCLCCRRFDRAIRAYEMRLTGGVI